MRKRSIVAGAAAALLVVGTGGTAIGANLALLGTDRDASNVGQLEVVTARAQLDTDPTTTDASEGSGATQVAATADGITAAEAVAIAAAEVGGTLLEVEWTVERGRSVYEVERLLDDGRRVEVYVDAADGTVLEVEVEGRASAAPTPSSGPAIGADRAVEIAVAEVGGTLVEVERDREDGVDVYGVYLRQADGSVLDVHVDAVTGAVLRVEVERRATSSSGTDSSSGSATPAPAPAPSGSSGTDIGADRAARIALAQVGGTLVDVETDREDGVAVYDVEVRQADGRILGVDVDRSTGAVLRVEAEDSWDEDEDDDWDDDEDDDDWDDDEDDDDDWDDDDD